MGPNSKKGVVKTPRFPPTRVLTRFLKPLLKKPVAPKKINPFPTGFPKEGLT